MGFSHQTTVRISLEDKTLLDSKNIGYSEAIQKFCHELRIGDELFLTRGLNEAKEKIEKLVNQRDKFMSAAKKSLNAEQFDKFIEAI
jgi:DNA-binding MurR/RpiR family transcriptional regulator